MNKVSKTSTFSLPFYFSLSLLTLLLSFIPSTAKANPTGAPLMYFPVEPCRFLDTRVSSPIPNNTAIDAYVRGSNLQASDGALRSDCHIPASAQAVTVNFTAVSPNRDGYLKINGSGFVAGPEGPYCRMIYEAEHNSSNEMTISLCNTTFYPFPHQPCPFDGSRYLDFQILNVSVSGGTVHVAGDVTGYFSYVSP